MAQGVCVCVCVVVEFYLEMVLVSKMFLKVLRVFAGANSIANSIYGHFFPILSSVSPTNLYARRPKSFPPKKKKKVHTFKASPLRLPMDGWRWFDVA